MTPIEKHRKKVDKINQKILKLLYKRMTVCKKIGCYKKSNNEKITDKEREKQMLKRISHQLSKYNLSKPFVNTIFKEILNESKRIQAC